VRTVGVICAVLALAACGTASAATSLTITARSAKGAPAKTWTLRCGPARGTLPHPGRACVRLATLKAPFAPVPRDAMCSQIYGGPQVARVQGVYLGRKIDATFERTDGCETARWNRVAFLFPIFSGTLPPPR